MWKQACWNNRRLSSLPTVTTLLECSLNLLSTTPYKCLLSPYCCNLCCNHSACPDLTTLIPPAIGSEVGVSLLAGTFYLIKVQPKWNLRNTMIWSQPGTCYCISDVLWLCLRGENQSRAAVRELHPACWQVTVNQQSVKLQRWTPYWEHIANTVNSNKNMINH